MSAGAEFENEPSPDLGDVQQHEPEKELPTPPVPVVQQGPVMVQQLPTRTASMRAIALSGLETIAGEDDRRASLTLYARALGPGFYVGTDRQMVSAGAAAFFDSGQVVVLRTTERLYARADDNASEACRLTVVQELWAD
ncbi:hypothetical protein E1265_21370 [Streptomyces sp. 8K308]|uniref:hypothetical protein n=1 Tax=Streptomyces sp. 8K308 TaxID=2530388 RepID=UPI001044D547|nr:hypothetical protein [Streptomyces sp. 8K308]TDC20623.1 hypothetical protein E1265_21370 [Streptomyces sp. 8K308]